MQRRYRYERIFYDDPENSTGAKEYVWTAATGVPDFDNAEVYNDTTNWKLKEEVDALPEDQQHWLTEWKDTSVMANLPVAKPATFGGTDEAWRATTDAWTYTWNSLPATKTVDGATATCYYRAIEVSETPYNLAKVNDQDQTAYTGSRAVENASTGTETIVNTPTKLQLEVEKKWRKDGVEASWPADYTVNYQFYQDYHWGFWGPQIKVGDEFKQDMQNGVPYNLTDGNAHIVQFGVWGTYPTNITLTLGDVTMSTADGGTVQYTVPAGVDNVEVTGSATQEGGGQQGGDDPSETATIADFDPKIEVDDVAINNYYGQPSSPVVGQEYDV